MTGNYLIGPMRMKDGTLAAVEAWEIKRDLEKYGNLDLALADVFGVPKKVKKLRIRVGRYTDSEKEMVKSKLPESLSFVDYVFGEG